MNLNETFMTDERLGKNLLSIHVNVISRASSDCFNCIMYFANRLPALKTFPNSGLPPLSPKSSALVPFRLKVYSNWAVAYELSKSIIMEPLLLVQTLVKLDGTIGALLSVLQSVLFAF